jgi:hypothetical protein
MVAGTGVDSFAQRGTIAGMGHMKDLLATVYGGGDEAVAAVERIGKDWREQLEQAASEIERRWIPVGERLPERNKMVCVVCKGHATVGTYSPMMLDWWAMMPFTSNMVPTRLVTHWMPLPEPPEVK